MAAGEEGTSRLQVEVEQVTMIMHDNKEKAEERFNNLTELDQQADELLEKSKTFEKTTRKLKEQRENKRDIKRENNKTRIIIITLSVLAGLIFLGVVIFFIMKK